ncbi:MAG: site-specific DNA-methyltransferase [Chloracidobacterium sp.]|nr:site-specific DNA-methyltransferase [Chloracidobacterium sp.]
MPIKYVPYFPNTIDGQAILNNFVRTRRMLAYRDADKVEERIRRGMPLYEVEEIEKVNGGGDNLVIRGECVSACAYLKDQGIKVDLVYIDPPFASGADYAKKIYLRKNPKIAEALAAGEELEDDELKAFEEKMYGDIWHKEQYLNWMYENLVAIRSVMSETASIYVHLDWHIGHYVKILMDEVFGEDNFMNEIVWHYPGREMHISNKFNAKHDTLFLYGLAVDKRIDMSAVAIEHDRDARIKSLRRKIHKDEDGKEWVWETRGQATGQEPYKRYLDEIIEDGQALSDVWSDIPFLRGNHPERTGYATQKPPELVERIVKASSNEIREDGRKTVVADFFGGSGVASKVADDLGRSFIHVDTGTNSIQTARDGLLERNADFTVLDIQDGVSLFRNPAQTMDKLKELIHGLRNEDKLDSFWEGAIEDSKLGMIPVYVPNLLDHSTKVLDNVTMNRIIVEAMPDLPDGVRKVVVYYIDIDDRSALEEFIAKQNDLDITIELRDLKEVLDNIVLNDIAEYELRKTKDGYEVEFTSFVSDRLMQKIDEYNQKRELQMQKKRHLLVEVAEVGEVEEEPEGGFTKIEISDNGLELIEMVSLDCTNKEASWKSDSEIKIDKNSFVILDGKKTKDFWDGKIASKKKPLRLKVRSIAGDETIIDL